MTRLVVEACTAEWTSGDLVYTVLLGVSVSRADDGRPVTGLKKENFRVASPMGGGKDFAVLAAYELWWEPGDSELSGCYQVEVHIAPMEKFFKGARYVFGIQARTFNKNQQVADQGQTILELISIGE